MRRHSNVPVFLCGNLSFLARLISSLVMLVSSVHGSERDPFKLPTDRSHLLLADPWDVYFVEAPQLLVVDQPDPSILRLMEAEQALVRSVLNVSGPTENSSEYVELNDFLEELKELVPSSQTAYGYVYRKRRSSIRYTYVSGSYIRVGSSGTYTYFKNQQKSSSPDMVRSVERLVHNAQLNRKDIQQRIQAIDQIDTTWTRRTNLMNSRDSSGITKRANLKYLEALREFKKEMVKLENALEIADKKQAEIEANKAQILSEWMAFEASQLPILHQYFEKNTIKTIQSEADDIFVLDDVRYDQFLYLKCRIGSRDLYFDLSKKRSEHHPFVLLDLSPE